MKKIIIGLVGVVLVSVSAYAQVTGPSKLFTEKNRIFGKVLIDAPEAYQYGESFNYSGENWEYLTKTPAMTDKYIAGAAFKSAMGSKKDARHLKKVADAFCRRNSYSTSESYDVSYASTGDSNYLIAVLNYQGEIVQLNKSGGVYTFNKILCANIIH